MWVHLKIVHRLSIFSSRSNSGTNSSSDEGSGWYVDYGSGLNVSPDDNTTLLPIEREGVKNVTVGIKRETGSVGHSSNNYSKCSINVILGFV